MTYTGAFAHEWMAYGLRHSLLPSTWRFPAVSSLASGYTRAHASSSRYWPDRVSVQGGRTVQRQHAHRTRLRRQDHGIRHFALQQAGRRSVDATPSLLTDRSVDCTIVLCLDASQKNYGQTLGAYGADPVNTKETADALLRP